MSQSIASAKKRRAPNEPVRNISSSTEQPPSSNFQGGGLTLPQVIQIVDRRLIILEKFMNEAQPKITNSNIIIDNIKEEFIEEEKESDIPNNIKDIVEEFDKRYELLAEEIVNLKNIVLNLQSYTLEVNKTLYEERKLLENNNNNKQIKDI